MPGPAKQSTEGLSELAAARAASRQAIMVAFVFSALVNVLMLTAPLYMLQVYDRVLVSRSEETLLALTLQRLFESRDPIRGITRAAWQAVGGLAESVKCAPPWSGSTCSRWRNRSAVLRAWSRIQLR